MATQEAERVAEAVTMVLGLVVMEVDLLPGERARRKKKNKRSEEERTEIENGPGGGSSDVKRPGAESAGRVSGPTSEPTETMVVFLLKVALQAVQATGHAQPDGPPRWRQQT